MDTEKLVFRDIVVKLVPPKLLCYLLSLYVPGNNGPVIFPCREQKSSAFRRAHPLDFNGVPDNPQVLERVAVCRQHLDSNVPLGGKNEISVIVLRQGLKRCIQTTSRVYAQITVM